MGADADLDEPVFALHPLGVGCGVAQPLDRRALGRGDVLRGHVADPDRLALPHHGDRHAGFDRAEIGLHGGERPHVGRRVERVDERPGGECRADPETGPTGDLREVAARRSVGKRLVRHGDPPSKKFL